MKRPSAAGIGACLSFALLATATAACSRHEAAAQHHPPPPPPSDTIKVRIAIAHDETLPLVYRASGTVRGRSTTVLTSKTTGYVRAVRVRSGDVVKAGQPLVELEANDVRAQVSRARASLDQSTERKAEAESGLVAARAGAKIAKSSYDRTAQLLNERAISQQQYDEAEARWRAAEAQEHMAEARLRSLGSSIAEARAALGEANITLGYAVITAPFSGRILERSVDPGALAAPGTALLTIADEGTLRVEAAVAESHADDINLGDEADIEIETAAPKPIVGTIVEIVPNVDIAARAILVKLDLPPEVGPLWPGSFARVGFRVGTRPRLVVPTAAITSFGALDRVFVVVDDDTSNSKHAHLRMITRGDAQGPWTEILSGLSKGERVAAAVALSSGLSDGQAVVDEVQQP